MLSDFAYDATVGALTGNLLSSSRKRMMRWSESSDSVLNASLAIQGEVIDRSIGEVGSKAFQNILQKHDRVLIVVPNFPKPKDKK